MNQTEKEFAELVQVIERLRDPKDGCPWDLKQTHESLKPYLVEEAYELLEAIDSQDDTEMCSELGDVLLQVVLHAQLAKDRGAFEVNAVVKSIKDKMIRRHPHIFGDTKVDGIDDVFKNWEKIKKQERKQNDNSTVQESMLDGIPKNLPALHRAQRFGQKVAKVNFDWDSVKQVWNKVNEEFKELQSEIESDGSTDRLKHELGDLLFSLCQLARHLNIQAEDSLQLGCKRFHQRFFCMEQLAQEKDLSELSKEEWQGLWTKAKAISAP